MTLKKRLVGRAAMLACSAAITAAAAVAGVGTPARAETPPALSS